MTGNEYLLDTNIVSAWLENDMTIAANIEDAMQIFVPVIVIGEMYYGAQYSKRTDYNIDNISKVISNYTILFVDEGVCKFYGIIKASLRRKGKPIPENDIWIAAIAIAHNFILVTRDGHFKDVDGLQLRNSKIIFLLTSLN